MREWKKKRGKGAALAFLTLAVLVTVFGGPAQAGRPKFDCQVPLFSQSGVEPNIMILFDNSGSMNEAIYHPGYDPETVYAGGFRSDSMYYVSSTGDYQPNDFSWSLPSSPTARLVASFEASGRYLGNYMNWIYYIATDEQRAALPQVTRITVAKTVMSDFVFRADGALFGLSVFDYSDGAEILEEVTDNRNDVIHEIQEVVANSWTPLGESMEDMLDYFTGNDSPIEYECQYNFLIVMTDGFPTKDRSVSSYLVDADNDGNDPGSCESIGAPYPNSNDCSDHMDDIAYYMRHNDLIEDIGEPGEWAEVGQTVITYTIGFGLDAYILEETARNGDGIYFTADDADELAESLERILIDIIMRISSGNAVALISTEQGDPDLLCRAKFMPATWRGFLEAYERPIVEGADPIWEASRILKDRNPNSRQIYTALGNSMMEFTANQASTLKGPMYTKDISETMNVINWTRGKHINNKDYRDREGWILGDIVHSKPVVVGPPNNFVLDEDYQTFLAYYADRPKMVYVGANDGMLHAFYALNGEEAWAFIPEFSLPKLYNLSRDNYCHLFYCDQTPAVRDIKVNGIWRTMLVAGGRQGGYGYFALDVTEPTSPSLMWQIELPHPYPFGTEPEFVSFDGQSVALVGSGLDDDDEEAYLYSFDLATGERLGLHYLSSGDKRNKPTQPAAVDLDLDGTTDIVYVGDLDGNMWRAETNGNPNPATWTWTVLFTCERPITAPPHPAYGEGGKVYVYFGTGAYLDKKDLDEDKQESFYCVYDSHDGATYSEGDLVNQTGSPGDIGTAPGWYIDLWHEEGERVINEAVVVAGEVFFTAFAPAKDECTAGGTSWLYRMMYNDGSAIPEDQGGDGERDVALGEGIASMPVADIANEEVIVQTSDAEMVTEDIGPAFFNLRVRSWQESYDFVEEPTNDPYDPPDSPGGDPNNTITP